MLALSAFFDLLPLMPLRWDIQRNDELSGVGDGVIFQAELAPPLWTAEVSLRPVRLTVANRIGALVNRLRGAQEPFLFRDPYICAPALDPTGAGLSSATVQVASASGGTLGLTGLPAGYALSTGDKIQIVTAGGKHAFVEASEDVTANGSGVTGGFDIFPNLPAGLAAGNAVTLVRPACACVIVPKSYRPGTGAGSTVRDIGFTIIQKRGV